jgi:hypothetical protein
MKHPLHVKKDYYGGALLMIVGIAASYAAVSYRIGTLSAMGPGYFPFVLGILIAITGALIAISAAAEKGPEKQQAALVGHGHGMPDLRGALCIILATVAFYFIGDWFGLLPATFAITFISALGDRDNTWKEAAILSVVMVVVAAVVFYWALKLQMPLYKWIS